jgi:hypothetical protein
VPESEQEEFNVFLNKLRAGLIKVLISRGSGREVLSQRTLNIVVSYIYQPFFEKNPKAYIRKSAAAGSLAKELRLESEVVYEALINSIVLFDPLNSDIYFQMSNGLVTFLDTKMYIFEKAPSYSVDLQRKIWDILRGDLNLRNLSATTTELIYLLANTQLKDSLARKGLFSLLQEAHREGISELRPEQVGYITYIARSFAKKGTKTEKQTAIAFLKPALTWSIDPSQNYGRMPLAMQEAIFGLIYIPETRAQTISVLKSYLRNDKIDYKYRATLILNLPSEVRDLEVFQIFQEFQRTMISSKQTAESHYVERLKWDINRRFNSCTNFL